MTAATLPIRDVLRRVMLRFANAPDDPAETRARLLICREHGWLTPDEAKVLGLALELEGADG